MTRVTSDIWRVLRTRKCTNWLTTVRRIRGFGFEISRGLQKKRKKNKGKAPRRTANSDRWVFSSLLHRNPLRKRIASRIVTPHESGMCIKFISHDVSDLIKYFLQTVWQGKADFTCPTKGLRFWGYFSRGNSHASIYLRISSTRNSNGSQIITRWKRYS